MRGVSCQEKRGKVRVSNYGGHIDTYPHAYFTSAAAIGVKKEEIDVFIDRLDKNWKQYQKDLEKKRQKETQK